MISVINMVKDALSGCESVLDICCGDGWVMRSLNLRRMTGIEAFKMAAEDAVTRTPYATIINADAREAIKKIPGNSFDAAILIDAIEHFTKDDGLRLLAEAQRVARKRLVIFTPIGYVENDPAGNPGNAHLSGWQPEEFQGMAYMTVIIPKYHTLSERKSNEGAFLAIKDIQK